MGATPDPTFEDLTPPERNLVSLMQSVWCGRLAHLVVHDGQPVLGSLTKVTRTLKLRDRQPPPPRTRDGDFALRREVWALVTQIRSMGHGTIERVEVLHGLPTVAEVSAPLAATSTPATSTPPPAR